MNAGCQLVSNEARFEQDKLLPARYLKGEGFFRANSKNSITQSLRAMTIAQKSIYLLYIRKFSNISGGKTRIERQIISRSRREHVRYLPLKALLRNDDYSWRFIFPDVVFVFPAIPLSSSILFALPRCV